MWMPFSRHMFCEITWNVVLEYVHTKVGIEHVQSRIAHIVKMRLENII